jgi:hypothetical protein
MKNREFRSAKNHELRYLSARELRVAKNADGTRTLTGSVCYNSLSCDLGGFKELIAPGAFAAHLDDVLCLRDHKPTLLMGRTKSKTLTLKDTPEELQFTCKLPDTEAARSLAESVDRGDLDGVSFGFSCIEDAWAVTGDDVVRSVLEAALWEISPCSWAAYPANSVAVRSCPPELRVKILEKRGSGCACDCDACVAGDCENCSNPDCDDPNCEDSERTAPRADPAHAISESDRQRMQMKVSLRSRKAK